MHLPRAFMHNLFSSLEGQTRGLLLTGGEPTISPLFPETLAYARSKGFLDIAVVTNGSQLLDGPVADALLEHATTIRLSMYDWDAASCSGIRPSLERIESLRKRIEMSGSPLKIGISVLTSRERVPRLAEIGEAVRSSGAHWVYYHPMCSGWGNGNLVRMDQTGVPETLSDYLSGVSMNGFRVFFSPARYADTPLNFDRYHAAHFLLVIGADGVNYLGPEVKYQERFAIADVAGSRSGGFLHRPERLASIASIKSSNYSALNSRHRGVLYNNYITRLFSGELPRTDAVLPDKADEFWFPHIL
jgi:hypothetical protein